MHLPQLITAGASRDNSESLGVARPVVQWPTHRYVGTSRVAGRPLLTHRRPSSDLQKRAPGLCRRRRRKEVGNTLAAANSQTPVLSPAERARPVVRSGEDLPTVVPAPIPEAWIVEGYPQANAVELTPGGKGRCSSGLWTCTAGKFDWYYATDEVVRITSGYVHLRFADHEQIARTGDVVAFRGGTVVRWTIPEYIEKFWVLGPPPTLLARVSRKLAKLVRRA